MSKLINMRNLTWALALGLTIWLALNAPDEQGDIIQATQSNRINNTQIDVASNAIEHNNTLALKPRTDDITIEANLFGELAEDTQPSVKKTPIKIPLIKPAAPRLPFEYLGWVNVNEQRNLLLSMNDEMLMVKVGDMFAKKYKLTAIETVGDQSTLKFLYLPMKSIQTMVVSNAK